MNTRKLTEAKKKYVAGTQYYKCANKPGSKITGLKDYNCPLWCRYGENIGSFDESGYDIDHIEEHCINQNDDIENLQALCKNCHSTKTKRFLMKEEKNNKDSKKTSIRDLTIKDIIKMKEEKKRKD
jgi:5-methylcytosine-specific restriction endonuclease McrA